MAAISSDSSKTMTTPLSSVSPEKTSLKISDVVNIFVKMRRAKPAPPELESASGEPQSHPGLSETTTSDSRLPLERTDIFLCNDAVNAPTLLRATRLALLTTAEHMGADILLDEQCVLSRPLILAHPSFSRWQISIRSLKHSRTKQYRVQV